MILRRKVSRADEVVASGSILILALGALALLSALALAGASHVGAALRLARYLDNDLHAGLAARAGVEAALAVTLAQTNGWDGLEDDPERFDRIRVGVKGVVALVYRYVDVHGETTTSWGIVGEEARINLNRADPKLLAALFQVAAGMDPRQAAQAADRVIERRAALTENARLTREAENGYSAGLESLETAEEDELGFLGWHDLAAVDDLDPDTLIRIRPHATLWGSGQVNVNIAGPVVLTAVGVAADGSEPVARALAANIVACRDAGNQFRDFWRIRTELNDFGLESEELSLLDRMVHRLRVVSTCFGGEAVGRVVVSADAVSPLTRTVAFVIRREPLKVLSWHEY